MDGDSTPSRGSGRQFLLAFLLLSVASSVAHAQEDALDRVKKKGELRWTADTSGGAPYVFEDPRRSGRFIGFEADLADALAEKLGVKAVLDPCDYEQIFNRLGRGDVDLGINGIELTGEKRKVAELSRPYYVAAMRLAVRAGSPPVASLEEMKGKTIGVVPTTLAERLVAEAGATPRPYNQGFELVYQQLAQGLTDGVLTDDPTTLYYATLEPGVKVLEKSFGELRYVIACAKGQARLRDAVDGALEELRKERKLRAIYEKWGLWNADTAILLDDRELRDAPRPGYDYWVSAVKSRPFLERVKDYPEHIPALLVGALKTLLISLASFAGAVCLGIVLAISRRYGPLPLRWFAVAYIEVFRGTPLLVQLFFIYFGLPDFGIAINPYVAGILGLALNYAAAEAENYRAGLESVPSGQLEASWALGLSTWQAVRYVVIPQAVRIAIPPATNDFIALLKDSSLVSAITATELLRATQNAVTATRDSRGFYALCALIYLLLGLPFSRLARWAEQRMSAYLRRAEQ